MKKAMLTALLTGVLLLAALALQAKSSGVLELIEINPNPMDKFTVITITFNQPANVGVNIETDTGIVLKTLYWGPADEELTLTWNRLDDGGNTVPSGKYLVVVNYAGRYTSTKRTIILK